MYIKRIKNKKKILSIKLPKAEISFKSLQKEGKSILSPFLSDVKPSL